MLRVHPSFFVYSCGGYTPCLCRDAGCASPVVSEWLGVHTFLCLDAGDTPEFCVYMPRIHSCLCVDAGRTPLLCLDAGMHPFPVSRCWGYTPFYVSMLRVHPFLCLHSGDTPLFVSNRWGCIPLCFLMLGELNPFWFYMLGGTSCVSLLQVHPFSCLNAGDTPLFVDRASLA